MGQTIRRQPGSVDVPTKDYIYHKNLIGFKGLDTRENPLVTDPLSCSDAKNVWVDENGNLTQRPRLQWVRRDLKVQDSDVVNVIYTDKAYWTLYYKEGTYSLTRTDLTTSTVTLFTIPEMASPKIGITEFQGTYYLGCSSGYYSCTAGQTEFTAIAGYIPVGSITDTGTIYEEPRNILNSNVRIATKLNDIVFETAGAIPLLEKMYCGGCLLSSSFEDDNNIRYLVVTIYNIITKQQNKVKCPINYNTAFTHVAETLRCGFTAFTDNGVLNITLVALDCNIDGSDGYQYIAVRHFIYNNGVLTGVIPATVWTRISSINPSINDIPNILTASGVFTGVGRLIGLKALCATRTGINIIFSYAQESAANRSSGVFVPKLNAAQCVLQGIFCPLPRTTLVLRACGYDMTAENIDATAFDFIPPQIISSDKPAFCILQSSIRLVNSVLDHGVFQGYTSISTANANVNIAYTKSAPQSFSGICIFAEYIADNDAAIYTIATTAMSEYKVRVTKYSNLTGVTEIKTIVADNYFSNSLIGVKSGNQTYTRTASTLYVLFQVENVSAIQTVMDKNGVLVWTGTYDKLLIPNSNSSTKSWFAFEDNIGALSADDLTISFIATGQTWQIIAASEAEVSSLRGVLFLDNVYWWFGETNIYGTMNDDLTYLPETRKLDAPSKILNWVRLTDTSFIVFCESDTVIYYKDSSSNLWLRTVLNLPFEIISPDETSEACYAALNTGPTYVTRNGIYEIALSENLFTNERQAQNISMTLATLEGGLLQKIIPNLLHIQTVRYKDWQLFVFKRQAGLTEVIAQEISTYNYFYWTLPIDFVSTYLAEGEVYLVDKNAITYKLAETELLREYKNGDTVIASVKCYGDEVFNETEQTTELKQIDWFWHSAVLNLDTIQYYKTLLALIFGMNDYDDASRVMFEYQTDIYYKSHTEQPVKVYDDYVYKIRNTQKQAPIPRFMYIRVRCESVPIPDAPDCLPEEFMCKVNLSQITFKYKVLRGSLL